MSQNQYVQHIKNLSTLIQQNMTKKTGTHLYLLRHGQSLGNHTGSVVGWTDSKLSVKGRHQANAMFRAFQPFVDRFTSIHSSDLSRCTDTVKFALGFPQRAIIKAQQLRQLNFGNDQGRHYDSMPKQQKSIMSSLKYQAPNGQNWPQARERAIKYLAGLDEGHHLISTHGGLMCALTYEFGIKEVVNNCSVLAAEICKDKKDIKSINFDWRYVDDENHERVM